MKTMERIVNLFEHGSAIALRLPKGTGFDQYKTVELVAEGDTITLRPFHKSWRGFFEVRRGCPRSTDIAVLRDNPPLSTGAPE